ncbi:hypothetical protein B0H14DRAFT_3735628 [Mycena olivaceomarginata]|nr:hypothetical protein B0H14DRAFT_3735628 [Mycena olivaceomarginata]
MELHQESDELFYATFPDARPSMLSSFIAAEHARIFMPLELARVLNDLKQMDWASMQDNPLGNGCAEPALDSAYSGHVAQNPEPLVFKDMSIAGSMPTSSHTQSQAHSSAAAACSETSPCRMSLDSVSLALTHSEKNISPGVSEGATVPTSAAIDKRRPACFFCRKRKIACLPVEADVACRHANIPPTLTTPRLSTGICQGTVL